MERKRSFDEGGLHIVEPGLSSDCVDERTARPAVQYVSRNYLQKQGFVHGRPLFLQVRAEKSDESAAPGTRVKATQRYDLSSKHMLTLGVSPSCDITIADTTQTVGERHARVFK